MPVNWKLANITPVFKKDDPTLPSNYRPISSLSVVSKVLERCIFNRCYQHLEAQLYHLQHGFLKGKSTTTQLLQVYHSILKYEFHHQQEKTLKGEHELTFAEVSSLLMLQQCTTIFLAIIKIIFVLTDSVHPGLVLFRL